MIKKKVLIIDDEPRLANIMKLHLEATDQYEVRLEHKGARGLSAAKAFGPHFIFLDMMMPDLNGFEVMYQLEADPDLKNVPVVFLTGALAKEGPSGDPESDDFMIGKYPYVVKPAPLEFLVECIEKHIAKKKS